MPDLSSTTLNPGTGGDAIVDDAVTMKDGASAKQPVSKLVTGAAGALGELVYDGNPLPVSIQESGREQRGFRGTGRAGTGRMNRGRRG